MKSILPTYQMSEAKNEEISAAFIFIMTVVEIL